MGRCVHKHHLELSKVLRSLAREAFHFYTVSMIHTRSHRGDPWNEYADSVAKHYTTHQPPPMHDRIYRRLSDAAYADWAWLHYDQELASAYPPFTGAEFHYRLRQQTAEQQIEPPMDDTVRAVSIQMGAATYNARSFCEIENDNRPQTVRQNRHQRLKRLRAQFHELDLHIIGIQEARGTERRYKEDGFLHYCAGAHNNNMGVALLINTTKPYATYGDKQWVLDDRHVRVLHSHTQALVATIQAPHLDITVAVLHTPTTAAAAEVR